jgi:hypothetical protein
MNNEGLKLVFYKVGRKTWFRLSYDGRTFRGNSVEAAMKFQLLEKHIRARVNHSTTKNP